MRQSPVSGRFQNPAAKLGNIHKLNRIRRLKRIRTDEAAFPTSGRALDLTFISSITLCGSLASDACHLRRLARATCASAADAGGGAAIGIAVERLVEGERRAERRLKWRGKKAWAPRAETPRAVAAGAADIAVDQLRLVMHAEFKARPLLNKSEARVFRELDRMVIARNPGWQVMAQVSVGEFIASADAAAYRCINSKRVDLLLMDESCAARHAIEYQGAGHHQGTAAARDAIKKEALRKAGIGYHEILAGQTTPAEMKRLVDRLVPERSAG